MADYEEKPERLGVPARETARRIFRHENAVLLVVLGAIVGVMAGITGGSTATPTNMMNILIQSSVRGVASIGQAFVILTAGIDLSVGGIGAMVAILGTSMITEALWQNIIGYPISYLLAVPIMLLVGTSIGAVNGLAVSRVGLPPLIATLALWQITRGIGFQIGMGRQIFDLPEGIAFFGQGEIAGVPVPVIIFFSIAAVAYFVLNHTTFGKEIYAVGGNPVSAWLSGVDVKKTLFRVYLISGFLAAFAAIIMTSRIMMASLRSMEGLEIDTIAAVVIGGVSLAGGRGNLIGVTIGVIILGVINNAMSVLNATPGEQGIVKGAIIFTAVMIDVLRRRS